MRYAIAGLILAGGLMLVFLVLIPLRSVSQPVVAVPVSVSILPNSVDADAARYAARAENHFLTDTANSQSELNADAARYTALVDFYSASTNVMRGEKADADRYTALARPDTTADSARYTALAGFWTTQAAEPSAVDTQVGANAAQAAANIQRGLKADVDRYMGLVELFAADIQRGKEADTARYTTLANIYNADNN